MAPRAFWKGYLKLSLVTCPVALTPATSEAEHVRLHLLNRATGHRVRSRYVDAVTAEPVEPDDQVKGHPVAEDDYILIEDEDLDAVALDSTRTIDIERFVPKSQIDRLWLDGAHYLTPDDPVGEEAFAVIRAAMEASDKVGIARLVLARRERHIMLEARGKGIVVWTLRYAGEIRPDADYFGGLREIEPQADVLELAERLVRDKTTAWVPEAFVDSRDAALEALIAAKQKGRAPSRSKETGAREPEPGRVIDIMEALRAAVAAGEKRNAR